MERETRERVSEIESKAYAFAREKGMKIRRAHARPVAEWRACSANVVADYMDKSGDLARQLMAAYGKMRTDPCCTAGPGAGPFTRR